ncbi:MAG: beta-hydroxyacyl-ACP dehydratase [Planctomycetes bacterium]|nr:beta-hydroxyacyl-ACP dehydratase [Planctomycetota bacterium]
MTLEAIKAAIPHREPFLLIDEIVEQQSDRIVCRKTFTGDEFWYRGHYPGYPITPGVLLCEAAMQAGAVLLSQRLSKKGSGVFSDAKSRRNAEGATAEKTPDPFFVPVATRVNNVQFKRMVLPGETILLEVELVEQLSTAFFLKGRVTVAGKVAVRLDFACTLTEGEVR